MGGKNSKNKNECVMVFERVFEGARFKPEDNLIENVCLLGPVSKNGRDYPDAAMSKAVTLYEGVKLFVNHPSVDEMMAGSRDVMKLAGKAFNCKCEGNKIRADVKVLGDDDAGRKFMRIAQEMPDIAGFSHNAKVKSVMKNGREVVEEITKVYSVDLVAYPATTVGMFEEDGTFKEYVMDYSQITLEELRALRKDIVEPLVAEGKAARDSEVAELKVKLEGLESKAREADNRKKIGELIAAEKMPQAAASETFISQCLKCPQGTFEQAVKELIKDRMSLISTGGVRNMGGEKNTESDNGDGGKQGDQEKDKCETIVEEAKLM